MSKSLRWVSSSYLLDRWGITEDQLVNYIEKGLPAYKSHFSNLKQFDLLAIQLFVAGTDPLKKELPKLRFLANDIERMELQNEALKQKSSKLTQPEGYVVDKEFFTFDEIRELNRFRKDKEAWEDSISAAFHIGLLCAKLAKKKLKITKDDIDEEIFHLGFIDLPELVKAKIWEAIPSSYRQN